MLSTLAFMVVSCTPVHFVAPDTSEAVEQIARLFPEACPITPAEVASADDAGAEELAPPRSYLFKTPLLEPPAPSSSRPVLRPVIPATPVQTIYRSRKDVGPPSAHDWTAREAHSPVRQPHAG